MAKKTAAQTHNDEAVNEMDSMFGFEIIPLGATSIKMRRVLSRKQQRLVGDVVTAIQQTTEDLNTLLAPPVADEDGNTPEPLTDEEMMAGAEALEDTMHTDFIRGIAAFVINMPELQLDLWGTPSLSQLFTTLRTNSSVSVKKAVGAHFPRSGPSA